MAGGEKMSGVAGVLGTGISGGLGRIFMEDFKALNEVGLLDTLYCLEEPENINTKIEKIIPPVRTNNYEVKDSIFDYLLSFRVKKCQALHTLVSWSPSTAKLLKNKYDTKIVLNAPSSVIHEREEINRERAKFGFPPMKPLFNRLIDEGYKTADYIICPTERTKKNLSWITEAKIKVIHPGVDIIVGKAEIPEEFSVLHHGVNFRKGSKYLMEAVKDTKIKTVFVGNISPEFQHFQFSRNIKLLGLVDDMEDIFKNTSVAVIPSVSEGMPSFGLEAMAHGIPLIVSNQSGINEIIQDGKEGFIVSVRDSEAIKEKILYFRDNPYEIKRMGRHARETIIKYSWLNYRYEVQKFYKEEII